MNEENIRLFIRSLYYILGLLIPFAGIFIALNAADRKAYWEAGLVLGIGAIPVYIVLYKLLSEK